MKAEEENTMDRSNHPSISMGSGKDDLLAIPSKDDDEGLPGEVFEDGWFLYYNLFISREFTKYS